MFAIQTNGRTITLFVVIGLLNSFGSLAKEYGDPCTSDSECMSADLQNPLICFDPTEGTTTSTTPASTEGTSSTTPVSTEGTTSTTPASTEGTTSTTPVSTEGTTLMSTEADTEEPTTAQPPETTEDATSKSTEGTTSETTEESTSQTTEENTSQTTEESTSQTTEENTSQTTEENTSQTTEESTSQTTEESTSQTTEESTSQTTEESTSQTTEETTENPTSEIPEDPTSEPTSLSEGLLEELDFKYDDFMFEQNYFASGVCHCLPDMIRNIKLNRCVVPASGMCDEKNHPERTCTKFSQCWPQYSNSTEGLCYCNSNAVVDQASGTCKLKYGSSECLEHEDCDVRNWLTCENNKCVCMYDNLMKWNPKEEKCGFLAGESCAHNPPFPEPACVENALCSPDNNICTCDSDSGFMETPNKECKLSYDKECNENSDCHPFFVCTGNTCKCPEEEFYNSLTGRCYIPEGSACDDKNDGECIVRATCVNNICECEPGYLASSDHACHAQYDSKCSENVPCHLDEYLGSCNTSFPFCQCKQNYRYNPQSKRCTGNLNEECQVDQDCLDHAICEGSSCVCGGNYIPGSDNTACFTHFGESCSSIGCYPGHFLKCDQIDLTCTCENGEDQAFHEGKGYCVALVGRLCGESSKGIECVENSVCGVDGSETKCTCDAGYVADASSGRCVVQPVDSSAIRHKIINYHVIMVFLILPFSILLTLL